MQLKTCKARSIATGDFYVLNVSDFDPALYQLVEDEEEASDLSTPKEGEKSASMRGGKKGGSAKLPPPPDLAAPETGIDLSEM